MEEIRDSTTSTTRERLLASRTFHLHPLLPPAHRSRVLATSAHSFLSFSGCSRARFSSFTTSFSPFQGPVIQSSNGILNSSRRTFRLHCSTGRIPDHLQSHISQAHCEYVPPRHHLHHSLTLRSRVARIANQEPWFPSHPERDVYISLLQLDPPAPEALLKAALLRRAVADVRRILAFREDKTALQALLQKGSIGDDLWNAFLAAEKELGAELAEVVNEANTFREGWGQFIFQSASEMVNNIKTHDLYMSIPKMKAEAGELNPASR